MGVSDDQIVKRNPVSHSRSFDLPFSGHDRIGGGFDYDGDNGPLAGIAIPPRSPDARKLPSMKERFQENVSDFQSPVKCHRPEGTQSPRKGVFSLSPDSDRSLAVVSSKTRSIVRRNSGDMILMSMHEELLHASLHEQHGRDNIMPRAGSPRKRPVRRVSSRSSSGSSLNSMACFDDDLAPVPSFDSDDSLDDGPRSLEKGSPRRQSSELSAEINVGINMNSDSVSDCESQANEAGVEAVYRHSLRRSRPSIQAAPRTPSARKKSELAIELQSDRVDPSTSTSTNCQRTVPPSQLISRSAPRTASKNLSATSVPPLSNSQLTSSSPMDSELTPRTPSYREKSTAVFDFDSQVPSPSKSGAANTLRPAPQPRSNSPRASIKADRATVAEANLRSDSSPTRRNGQSARNTPSDREKLAVVDAHTFGTHKSSPTRRDEQSAPKTPSGRDKSTVVEAHMFGGQGSFDPFPAEPLKLANLNEPALQVQSRKSRSPSRGPISHLAPSLPLPLLKRTDDSVLTDGARNRGPASASADPGVASTTEEPDCRGPTRPTSDLTSDGNVDSASVEPGMNAVGRWGAKQASSSPFRREPAITIHNSPKKSEEFTGVSESQFPSSRRLGRSFFKKAEPTLGENLQANKDSRNDEKGKPWAMPSNDRNCSNLAGEAATSLMEPEQAPVRLKHVVSKYHRSNSSIKLAESAPERQERQNTSTVFPTLRRNDAANKADVCGSTELLAAADPLPLLSRTSSTSKNSLSKRQSIGSVNPSDINVEHDGQSSNRKSRSPFWKRGERSPWKGSKLRNKVAQLVSDGEESVSQRPISRRGSAHGSQAHEKGKHPIDDDSDLSSALNNSFSDRLHMSGSDSLSLSNANLQVTDSFLQFIPQLDGDGRGDVRKMAYRMPDKPTEAATETRPFTPAVTSSESVSPSRNSVRKWPRRGSASSPVRSTLPGRTSVETSGMPSPSLSPSRRARRATGSRVASLLLKFGDKR
jgi:hypothetical protein